MNPRPTDVKVLDNYELLILFQNGEQKIFDVKPLLNLPLYQPLQNKALFHSAKADGMCVCWNDDIGIKLITDENNCEQLKTFASNCIQLLAKSKK